MEIPHLVARLAFLKHNIVQGSKSRILRVLQDNDIDVKIIRFTGDSVLHLVFQNYILKKHKVIDILKIFIERGVDPNIKNFRQETPLHLALTTWNREIVDYLLSHNAKIDVLDDKGNTVLHYFFNNLSEKLSDRDWNYGDNVNVTHPAPKIQVDQEKESAEFVNWLLFKGFDCDCKNKLGDSALHLAIEYNLQHVLPILLRHTRDINFISELEQQTLLQSFLKASNEQTYSYSFGSSDVMQNITLKRRVMTSAFNWQYNIEIVQILLEKGVSIDHEDRRGRTALHLAVDAARTKTDMDIVKMIFERFTKVHGNSGHSLLCAVIKKAMFKETHTECYLEMLTTLISKGKDFLNSKDKDGFTALYYAVKYNNLRAIELMQENGADFNALTNDGNNLFHALAESKLDDKSQSNVDRYQEDFFDFLVSQNCDVNAKNLDGQTPLHVAVDNANVIVIYKLATNGADVNCPDKLNDSTPLHLATSARIPSINVIELLLDYGANVNCKSNRDGLRPIHLAAYFNISNSSVILNMLLTRKAEVNARNFDGNSPLVRALLVDCVANVDQLLAYGADINDVCVTRVLKQIIGRAALRCVLRHWIKLNTAKLTCSKEYEAFIGQIPNQFTETCLKEIEQLKITNIDRDMSLYQWLHLDPNERYLYSSNDNLQSLVKSPTLANQFPHYSTVILGCYRETLTRKALCERAKEALLKLIDIYLPDPCLECILAHLNTGYVLDIVELANEDNEQR